MSGTSVIYRGFFALAALTIVALAPLAAEANRAAVPRLRPNKPLTYTISSVQRAKGATVYIPRSHLYRLGAAGTAADDGKRFAGASGAGGPSSGRIGRVETVVAGVALSGAIALIGLFVVRRRRRRDGAEDGATKPERAATPGGRVGGGLIVLLFAAGLGLALFSASNSSARSLYGPKMIRVIKSKKRWIELRDSVFNICPTAAPIRRVKG